MKLLFQHRKVPLGAAFIVAIVALRIIATGAWSCAFLIWNLALAIIPLWFAQKAISTPGRKARYIYAALWILFLPNATYLVTDLIHLPQGKSFQVYYDLVMLFSAAAYGVYVGLLSIRFIMARIRKYIPRTVELIIVPILLLACGYGMYLGRVERWNSWDVLTNPIRLLADIYADFRHPFRNANAWCITWLFATSLYGLYLLFVPGAYRRRHP